MADDSNLTFKDKQDQANEEMGDWMATSGKYLVAVIAIALVLYFIARLLGA